MRDKHSLHLHVRLVAHPLLDEAEEALIGVVRKLRAEEVDVERMLERRVCVQGCGTLRGRVAKIPYVTPRPFEELSLADDQNVRAMALACLALVSNANHVLEVDAQPPLHLAPAPRGH